MPIRSTVLALFALLLVPASGAQAQGLPLQLDIDTGSYLYGGGESTLEIYLSVGVHTLDFDQADDGTFNAQIPIEVAVYPASSDAPEGTMTQSVYEQTLDLQFVVADTLLLQSGREYVEQIRTRVPPGEYDVIATVPGAAGRSELELRANDVVVPDYESASDGMISSIQLASSIKRAEDGETDFVKSGLVIQPNPTGVFEIQEDSTGMRTIPYYAEIYGIDEAISADTYTVLAYIAQSNRPNPLPDHQQRSERRPARSVDVVAGRIDITTLPSGTYYLRIAALNAANEPIAERGQKLYVVNPTVETQALYAEGQDFESLLFQGMSEEEVDLELEQIEAIGSSSEMGMARSLEALEAKQNFLAAFWRGRDGDPNPNINDARRAFLQRLAIVNERYREPLTEGFRTERGRVFLKYGAPSQVDDRRFEAETIPYVVWRYNNIPNEGSSLFVFADRFSSGRLELIHSDVTGEQSSPNWQDELIRIR